MYINCTLPDGCCRFSMEWAGICPAGHVPDVAGRGR